MTDPIKKLTDELQLHRGALVETQQLIPKYQRDLADAKSAGALEIENDDALHRVRTIATKLDLAESRLEIHRERVRAAEAAVRARCEEELAEMRAAAYEVRQQVETLIFAICRRWLLVDDRNTILSLLAPSRLARAAEGLQAQARTDSKKGELAALLRTVNETRDGLLRWESYVAALGEVVESFKVSAP